MQSTMTYQKFNPVPTLLKLIFITAIALAVGYAISHAVERHPGDAEQVRNCLNDKGTLQVWMNPETGRVANVCQIDPTLFGIQIIQKAQDGWDELTAFVKHKMSRCDQVMQYLRNTGYIQLH